MTRYVGPTVETLLKRVREQGGLATDLDFATHLISICQQIVNIKLRRLITTATLNTKAEKLVYWLRQEIDDCVDVLSVQESGRELFKCDTLADLGAYDIDWFRKIDGTRFEAWLQFARDILIIYPGKASTSSVTVEYVQNPTPHISFQSSYNSEMQLPDDDVDFALLIAETVLLARSRKFDTTESKLERLKSLLNG